MKIYLPMLGTSYYKYVWFEFLEILKAVLGEELGSFIGHGNYIAIAFFMIPS